jgi:hypothetical protein
MTNSKDIASRDDFTVARARGDGRGDRGQATPAVRLLLHLPRRRQRSRADEELIERIAFSTKGAEKRKQHGCKGAHVFRDPNESDRVWAIFDWDEAGWQSFTSDPEVPAIFQEAGFTEGPPKSAEFLRQNDA